MKNNKALGQHWLKNRAILDQIAELSAHPGAQICIEIGPGLGTLTSSLFKHFNQVIAIEFDQNLATNLPKSFPGKHLTVINQDILKIQPISILLAHFGACWRELGSEPREDGREEPGDKRIELAVDEYIVAGNIPYYITSPIIKKLLTDPVPPQKIVLLIQKEVAGRIADFEKSSLLSLFTQNRADVKLGPIVPKAEFTPPPQVDSRVLILNPHPPIIPEEVFSLIKLGFHSPRKKLITNLIHLREKAKIRQILLSLQLSPDARPSDLRLQDWQALYQALTPSIS